jgi:cytochrome b subunit of formate dehydrogenase/nitrate/TMAO reductase-like tetraheme cytochrome c subunit
MKALLNITLLTALTTVGANASGQPPAGLPLPPEENSCATCHGEKDLWDGDNLRLFVPLEQLADDVHWKHGVNCHDCHGGDPSSLNFQQAHATEVDAAQSGAIPFRPDLSQKARTQARLETLVQVCSKCHQQASESYLGSVHGHGLQQSGLVVTAVCSDCHGHHDIYPAADPRSSLHSTHVGATCATCHRFIQERLQQSIHGQAIESPATADESASSGDTVRKPSCSDCHQGHDLPHPRSSAFRLGLPDRCGSCHAKLTNSYTRSLHGQLTELGYLPAAKCSDCHGSHDILPVADPASWVSTVNRRATCAKCHPDATDNFLEFDPHADAGNAQRDPVLYWVNLGLTSLLTTVFVVFGTHSFLWLVRSLPHVVKRGRPKYPTPGSRAYVRFRPVHRIAHAVLMTSFLGLALTGLPLRYSNYGWAQTVSWALGGFSSTGLWHRVFGMANICCLVFYILWFSGLLIIGPRTGISRIHYIFGPDSPVPNRRDPSDFAKMLRWFVGLGPKPTFERWTYWEKFDLWAASADIVLIGTTGLILWFPNEFCSLLPGQVLNIADLIHGKLALLATGFVFAIHFFSANLRPEKFPMDISIFTGVVSEKEMEEERPEFLQRLQESGQLQQYVAVTPSARVLALTMLVGSLALSIGLALLVGILIAAL